MARALFVLLLAAGMAAGCGPATAEHDGTPVANAAEPETPAAPAPAAPAPAASEPVVAGACSGGPGGSCCGGADGTCSQMAAPDDPDGGCPCQRRQRLIEKARARAGSE